MPIYDSMNQASAATGLPLQWFKEGKKAGCDAFRSNRVDLAKFLKWLGSKEGDESGINWNERLAMFKAKREEHKFKEDQKRVILKSTVRQGVSAGGSYFFTQLDRVRSEAPGGLKGKDERGIDDWMGRQINHIKTNLAEKFAAIGEGESDE
jgi:hypothetical protein